MKKIGSFFFCFLPLFASIALQFAAALPVMGICLLFICMPYFLSGTKIGYAELLLQLNGLYRNQNFAQLISVIFAVSGILLFGFWYARQFGGSLRFPGNKFSNKKLILGLALLVPGLQILSSVLTVISAVLFPGWMEFYEKLMQTAGFSNSVSPLLILYAVILGPIEEELTFRGVIFSSAQKALPFWAANVLQSLLFGIFHLNVIQGVYAFFIGLFFGYVCKRGGSIYLSIFLHILFNCWGTFVVAENIFLWFLPFVLLGAAGFFLFHKNTMPQAVNHYSDFSDM